MDIENLLGQTALRLGGRALSLGETLALVGAAVLLLAAMLLISLWRSGRARRVMAEEAEMRAREAESRMAGLLQAQNEMQGRVAAMTEALTARQAELTQSLGQRLDSMTGRIGQTMTEQTRATHESLSKLQERLAVIDRAQNNIQSLTGQVVQLQAILSNKQTRGAFGQSRMEAIVADGLPAGAYEFQATLSNGSRPDCLIRMPNGAPILAIDAKFPLEAWHLIRDANGPEARKAAAQAFRRDIEVHIKAIADKYLITGETQETAFMFVPSESVFAEIHENFEAVVQKAHRARVVIVSPSLLMLSIQVVQALLKDARMREQAHLIQDEMVRLMADVNRLDERVRKLQGHFGQTAKDIDDILVSTAKVSKRGQRIEALEFVRAAPEEPERVAAPAEIVRSAESRTGQLRLRVVEDAD